MLTAMSEASGSRLRDTADNHRRSRRDGATLQQSGPRLAGCSRAYAVKNRVRWAIELLNFGTFKTLPDVRNTPFPDYLTARSALPTGPRCSRILFIGRERPRDFWRNPTASSQTRSKHPRSREFPPPQPSRRYRGLAHLAQYARPAGEAS